jgi:hypothetical protein
MAAKSSARGTHDDDVPFLVGSKVGTSQGMNVMSLSVRAIDEVDRRAAYLAHVVITPLDVPCEQAVSQSHVAYDPDGRHR